MALRLVLVVPLPDLLAFRKFSRAWFSLTEVLAHSHTSTLVQQVGRGGRGRTDLCGLPDGLGATFSTKGPHFL
jgi:hypothetical protein